MKKIISILIAAALIPTMLIAQEETPKQYLPEQGDWAIGIDVIPVLNFLGNTFNNTANQNIGYLGGTPAFDMNQPHLMPSVSIMGKYMLTNDWAIKANFGLMIKSEYNRGYINDQQAQLLDPLCEDKVIDVENVKQNGLSLAVGAEYRKGSKRIQGIFGAGLLFGFTQQSVNYTWGNQMTVLNQNPDTYFQNSNNTPIFSNGYRTLSRSDDGANFFAGITGSVGFEWFVAPKVALGAEVNLSLYYTAGTQIYTVKEGYNPSLDDIEIRTDLDSPGNRGITFGTENLGGSLFMMFYF